jgi:hypothetical protein
VGGILLCLSNGNEQADRLAKHGAGQQQEENPVCLTEMKTIIKYLFKTPQQQDSYHQLRPLLVQLVKSGFPHNVLWLQFLLASPVGKLLS